MPRAPSTKRLGEGDHIVHGSTLSLAPRTFRPALPAVLATLVALVCCALSHAQIIDSTYILAVDRRVQEIDAAKDHGIRTLGNEEFMEQMRQRLNPACAPDAGGYRRSR